MAKSKLNGKSRFIPRDDVVGLTQLAVAVVNPSLFEGWSTTVEESKTLGVNLVVSSLAVHREQLGDEALYFDPYSVEDASEALLAAWAGPAEPLETRRAAFAGCGGCQGIRIRGPLRRGSVHMSTLTPPSHCCPGCRDLDLEGAWRRRV